MVPGEGVSEDPSQGHRQRHIAGIRVEEKALSLRRGGNLLGPKILYRYQVELIFLLLLGEKQENPSQDQGGRDTRSLDATGWRGQNLEIHTPWVQVHRVCLRLSVDQDQMVVRAVWWGGRLSSQLNLRCLQ